MLVLEGALGQGQRRAGPGGGSHRKLEAGVRRGAAGSLDTGRGHRGEPEEVESEPG